VFPFCPKFKIRASKTFYNEPLAVTLARTSQQHSKGSFEIIYFLDKLKPHSNSTCNPDSSFIIFLKQNPPTTLTHLLQIELTMKQAPCLVKLSRVFGSFVVLGALSQKKIIIKSLDQYRKTFSLA
jgi:hypothetical protein